MTRMVDLVADLGEGFGAYTLGDDAALLDIVSSANIACGFHAGDPDIMDATVAACVARGVAVGAHPSFPDLRGFGRRAMDCSAAEVRTDVTYQMGALSAFAAFHGTRVAHVAPHGRLGNLVGTRADYAAAVADAAAGVDPGLIIVAQDGELAQAARIRGLAVGIVGIADRAYQDNGTLVPGHSPARSSTTPPRWPGARCGWSLTAKSKASTASISRSRRTACCCTATTPAPWRLPGSSAPS